MGATYGEIMTILVTGVTGNIGRRIVDHLIDLGANDIRALTKNPAKANLPDGVRALTGYLGDPESLPVAFEGVERMYLAPLPKTLQLREELEAALGMASVAIRKDQTALLEQALQLQSKK